ncbi:MAG: hypothetical protein ACK4YM_04815 [Novosphingobium sp.]
MPTENWVIVGIFAAFALLELVRSNLLHKREQTRDDWIVELVSTIILLAVTQPLILLAVDRMLGAWQPDWRGALAGLNVLAAIGLFLVFDDMMQYWWHRA